MDAAFHKTKHAAGTAKDFAVKKIKAHRAKQALKEKISQPETGAAYTTSHEKPLLHAPKTRETTQTEPLAVPSADKKPELRHPAAPAQQSDTPIKTKEAYLKSQQKPQIAERNASPKILHETPKAKQAILSANGKPETVSHPSPETPPLPKQKAIESIKTKQQRKKEVEQSSVKQSDVQAMSMDKTKPAEIKEAARQTTETSDIASTPDRPIKTKEYCRAQQSDLQGTAPPHPAKDGRIKTKKADIKTFDRIENETHRFQSAAKNKQPITPMKQNLLTDTPIKQKPKAAQLLQAKPAPKNTLLKPTHPFKPIHHAIEKASPANIARKKAVAAARKQATKKAAQQAAQRTAQKTKATAKAAVRLTVKAAQAVAAAAKAIISAIAALGGWAVLLVILIVIIIVAAIAASPFGIFISEEAADPSSIPISSIVAECNIELSAQLDILENSIQPDRVVMEGEQSDWSEVLAVFAVKTAGAEDGTAEDVVVITPEKKEKIKAVFWDMNSISYRTETVTGERAEAASETVLYITIHTKTADDMITEYGFTAKQQEALATLLENRDVLLASSQSLAISDKTAKDVLAALPSNLSDKRKAVIKAACSLVGKVNYFWGGKSSAIGWDSEWGKLKLVTAEGSKTSGSMRPFGLDCSGFITWVWRNAGMLASDIGNGTMEQYGNCRPITWADAIPGDVAFYNDLSHVGIVAGFAEDGSPLIVHCASGPNNVVITGAAGFTRITRPLCFGD